MTTEEIVNLSLEELIAVDGFECECGKKHTGGVSHVIIESGAIARLPELIKEAGCRKPFILSGHDTFAAAGDKVISTLKSAGIGYSLYVFPKSPVKPTEETVGSAVMHYDLSCDMIIGVGSGVINDTGKILSAMTGRKYIIVGTAPSMDGYASATSSMDRDNLKISLPSTFAWAIVGDLDVLSQAPMKMLQAGVGDMVAKYVSIVEWQIAKMLIGEYYCPAVAGLVNKALEKVVAAADGLVKRDKDAVKAVMEGMVIAGMAMTYAGLSRPASGMEHYYSHVIDMRSLAFPEAKSDLHGIQVGVGTLYTLKAYEYIRSITPDREKALAFVAGFDLDDWNSRLRAFIGQGAEAMIETEKREGKYDRTKHTARLEKIISGWDDIIALVDTLPKYEDVYALLKKIGAPTNVNYLGYTDEEKKKVFAMTKDMRDKYVGTRLLWDLGCLDEAADYI